ncbi:N-acetyltransferase family protein [Dinoroseobacter sp. S124A]|uniref:GNAT family N-acetyltransferase n=1 Tax=Dinoroseobacter sp. S124A TaxID=3415128 RepID=UPI003C7A0314
MTSEVTLRRAEPADWSAIWEMLRPVFRAGATYAIDPEISEADARAYWMAPERQTFVAEGAEEHLGTYYLVANFGGPADHICNCGYVTAPAAQGRGVARAMLAHSLEAARHAGFRAMQYNCVVATNTRAVGLWQAHGFEIVGTLPEAFRHPAEGLVDAYVMMKRL